MKIQPIHAGFIMPTKGSEYAGAFDIYMPEAGIANGESRLFGLGFAAAVPKGYMALLNVRSSTGAKFGLELNNTQGWIDADYTGEWMAALRTKSGLPFKWTAGTRLLQCAIVPIQDISFELVEFLDPTKRGDGRFGSSGT